LREIDDGDLVPLIGRLTLEEKVRLLTGKDSWSLHPLPQIGLRSIVFSDGPAGVRGREWDERSPSVNFPSPTAVAASWTRSTAFSVGQGLGVEARRKGVDVVLAPTINLQRSPYGGRHFEAFSEDPILTAELATAYVRGVQGQGVGATVKHYVANDSETDRFTVDVRVSERALRELYLLAFEQPVVEGKAWLVMSAYNTVNGATATESPLLTSPLTDEWVFEGVVVSDWTAVRSIESARHPQDLAMPGPAGAWGQALVDAVQAGDIDEALVDYKILRILRLAARVGALDGLSTHSAAESPPVQRSAREIAHDAAVEGMVLLSNRSLLPLPQPASVAVIGEGARVARTQGGGSATVIPDAVISPLEGVRRRWPTAQVQWSLGAVVQSGIAHLPDGSYHTPDGRPGISVRYLDDAGTQIAREHRQASSLVWFDGETVATRAATIEMAFRYTPAVPAAEIPLGVAGLANYEVIADGRAVVAGELRTAPGDDPATAVLNPPSTAVMIPMSGDAVEVGVRFTPVRGGMPDALTLRVGVPPLDTDADLLIQDAVAAAEAAEVAVVVVSTSAEVESEGFDRTSLRLPGRQDDLVHAVAAANPRTVVVVNSGSPVLLPWRDEVAAVLAAWFPGQEFGAALADVLSGDQEPGGRLPGTWPAAEADVPVRTVTPTDGRLAYDEGIHIGYRAWLRGSAVPAYPFGHGLGYTTWQISDVGTPADVARDDNLPVTISLTNVGKRAGKAVVQIYLERMTPSDTDRPALWLAGFVAVSAGPGESVVVEVELSWRHFAYWDSGWRLEPGEYRLHAGLSSADLQAATTVKVTDATP
jgi:beta-glucosidase